MSHMAPVLRPVSVRPIHHSSASCGRGKIAEDLEVCEGRGRLVKTASCWFPALRECEGLGFIPPSRATEERGCFGVEGELEGKGEGKMSVGRG